MSIPKIIHFTVPSVPLPDQLRNIETARKLHPDWEVKVWQDPVDRTDFRLAHYWDKSNSGAQLADMIRMEVVHRDGGFYLDSDISLLRSLDPLRQYPFVIASQDGQVLTNAFFGAEQGHPALEHLITSLVNEEPDWALYPVVTTGPNFFVRELKWRDDMTVIPRETFYPYDWNERATSARHWTYGMHEWSFTWKPTFHTGRGIRNFLHHTKLKTSRACRRVINRISAYFREKIRLLTVRQPRSYPASGVICAQTVHGLKIYLSGEDGSVTPEIALQGTYEHPEELFLKRAIRPGDWAIDVGANVGLLSLICAQKVGPFGRVFCYEPNPIPASLLKRSLIANWMHDRTKVLQKALGSEPGRAKLRFSRNILGGATLASSDVAGTFENSSGLLKDEEQIEVDVSTLDADFPVDLPIRLLKIDAEGFEHHILRGGARLLERQCIDILMLECLREVYGAKWHEFVKELELILAHGYTPYTLTRAGKLRKVLFKHILLSDRGRNVVFVSKHALKTLSELS